MNTKTRKTQLEGSRPSLDSGSVAVSPYLWWGGKLLFFLFAWLYLGMGKSEMLFRLQESSVFMADEVYFGEVMALPAGLLTWVSRFLLQFYAYPLLGAAIFAVGLVVGQSLLERLMRVESVCFSYIPSILLLLLQAVVTYELHDKYESATGFFCLLSFLVVLLLFGLYRLLSAWRWTPLVGILLTAPLFIWIGPAVWGAWLMIAVDACRRKSVDAWWVSLLALALTLVVVCYASKYRYPAYFSYMLLAPCPPAFFSKSFTCVALFFVSLILSPLFGLIRMASLQGVKRAVVNGLLVVAMCGAVAGVARYPVTYEAELKMLRLTGEMDWKGVLAVAEQEDKVTRSEIAFRTIALANTNHLTANFFSYSFNYHWPSFDGLLEEHTFFRDYLMYSSFIQPSYRWCMEDVCMKGRTVATLKTMTLCSLLNDEPDLAKRYIGMLKRTLFWRSWAEKMEKYVGNMDAFYTDYPFMASVKSNVPQTEDLSLKRKMYEVYDDYKMLNVPNMERRLLTLIYRRDLDQFTNELALLLKAKPDYQLPVCMQEALVMRAFFVRDFEFLRPFHIQQAVGDRVSQFVKEYSSAPDKDKIQEKMAKCYGGTYSYFFAFCDKERLKNNNQK